MSAQEKHQSVKKGKMRDNERSRLERKMQKKWKEKSILLVSSEKYLFYEYNTLISLFLLFLLENLMISVRTSLFSGPNIALYTILSARNC